MGFKVLWGSVENLKVSTLPGSYCNGMKRHLVLRFGENIVVIDDNDRNFPVHIGDARKTSALYRKYVFG